MIQSFNVNHIWSQFPATQRHRIELSHVPQHTTIVLSFPTAFFNTCINLPLPNDFGSQGCRFEPYVATYSNTKADAKGSKNELTCQSFATFETNPLEKPEKSLSIGLEPPIARHSHARDFLR
jgi:hypothetical protein